MRGKSMKFEASRTCIPNSGRLTLRQPLITTAPKQCQMKAAELFVRCLENEGVEYVFGLPGEEINELLKALASSEKIRFILSRHEQAASFMADVYGRMTGKAGVCLSTLGPGATNLLTGVAD